ncbi:hypothetical protein BJ875DRAFT_438723 [Amylocarpus encephaloides]|uniref:Uncharacterized protein n=1 Tax=Amylocarpus encephaloides TaxID=45428 RepID=A0A9P7YNR5_9HELO|nr:hypothetical protein BJ875DRAFT_438723 [Amylocarpus encephaloides]
MCDQRPDQKHIQKLIPCNEVPNEMGSSLEIIKLTPGSANLSGITRRLRRIEWARLDETALFRAMLPTSNLREQMPGKLASIIHMQVHQEHQLVLVIRNQDEIIGFAIYQPLVNDRVSENDTAEYINLKDSDLAVVDNIASGAVNWPEGTITEPCEMYRGFTEEACQRIMGATPFCRLWKLEADPKYLCALNALELLLQSGLEICRKEGIPMFTAMLSGDPASVSVLTDRGFTTRVKASMDWYGLDGKDAPQTFEGACMVFDSELGENSRESFLDDEKTPTAERHPP